MRPKDRRTVPTGFSVEQKIMWMYSQTSFQKNDITLTGNGYLGYRGTLYLRQAVHRRKTTFVCDGALVRQMIKS